ncbi:TetR/AcrR family transcriptional regulator [Paraglaciecola aquimarina]|uniref:TetR/AcrR family transcriptional regulator n=1 Tax=Paraglaciecola aquimarina TaxID=1235557 RepID=A0ABU3SUB2_9ALTE|nr:TetR/AcrR family transcriptional regulator [Paraglaciecola aquimarina]MDU0353547.1 TetR/AcrR family transcriptional regulator [Paraglaciecola aquimarina]
MSSGRKLEFDSEVALDRAMHVFWQKGYVGASLSDLTQSMGINKPSMYRTFGNKESLFVKTTQRYLDTKMKPHLALLYERDVSLKQRLHRHMMSIVDMQCNQHNPMGCYLVLCQSELVSGSIPDAAKQVLLDADLLPKQIYTDLFNTDQEAIELGLNKHAAANALSVYTLLKGTASMARSAASQADLEYSVDSIIKGIGVH